MEDGRNHIRSVPAMFPHLTSIPARYLDLNDGGEIGHIALARIFSEGRSDFLSTLFRHVERPESFNFVVAQVAVACLFEPRCPVIFDVASDILEIGVASMRIGQVAFARGYPAGFVEAIIMSRQSGAALAIPDDVRTELLKWQVPHDIIPRLLCEPATEQGNIHAS